MEQCKNGVGVRSVISIYSTAQARSTNDNDIYKLYNSYKEIGGKDHVFSFFINTSTHKNTTEVFFFLLSRKIYFSLLCCFFCGDGDAFAFF